MYFTSAFKCSLHKCKLCIFLKYCFVYVYIRDFNSYLLISFYVKWHFLYKPYRDTFSDLIEIYYFMYKKTNILLEITEKIVNKHMSL